MSDIEAMIEGFGPPVINLQRYSLHDIARMDQYMRFRDAYPDYVVDLEVIPIDRFCGACTCRPIVIPDMQTVVVAGEDDCPVHGFGPGDSDDGE